MAVCAAFGIWAFTLFGALHDHGAHGHRIFHAHDCYHYYFGSKYLKEWGYDGMYLPVAPLEEVGREEPRKAITFNRIRDLDGSARFLYRADFEPRLAEARAHFSPARWAAEKGPLLPRDIESNNDWWHGVMLDNGFNPPPSFAAITGTVANVIPFDERTWKFLGLIDVALMGAGFAAIAWAFGAVPALFAIVITGNAPITTFNWTGGSFFRQLWLFCLMVGLSMLAKKKWYGAGAALGTCTACVFFPNLLRGRRGDAPRLQVPRAPGARRRARPGAASSPSSRSASRPRWKQNNQAYALAVDNPYPGGSRSLLRGQPFSELDATIFKTFHFTERVGIQLSMTA